VDVQQSYNQSNSDAFLCDTTKCKKSEHFKHSGQVQQHSLGVADNIIRFVGNLTGFPGFPAVEKFWKSVKY